MSGILFTFPGQGAQKPGMLHALPDHAEVRRTLEQAGAVLGGDPLRMDSAQALQSTVAVQLCLLICGVAMARVFAAHGARPDMVAGLSIGAYPAAVAAGLLDYGAALSLVRRRAQLMQDAYPQGYGMTAISGLDQGRLAPLIASVHGRQSPVYLANLNGPRQLVIAGADAALQAVAALALQAGASRAERLAVNVPSHCELYAAVALQMQAAFAQVTLHRPQLTYISGSAARALFDPSRIADDLAANVARQVHWHDTARHAWERGARLALEMPGGSVLTGLSAPLFDDGQALSCDASRLDNLLALSERQRGAL
ncbi:malonate decarboxylase subunit epsilon [Janthinobacterium agaricidamnosum]|uniref:Malonyl CoA-acyl carrier protein transacylase n=1 Tax=Janthinobacterium agaricidamnosum NBRC 102515 = DSM 9628 TaxID=1349767 RepID=W0V6X6_9BURK|nr:malonate decarboxylase subunit epsilon [Janthinobacterium agaricidamnosum]CDG83360.1 malonate decarboxylase, epsilon subunit [Janthinobacterium agaricidamnosum NBRC 102515 = DSM 9628]